jgi:hypothetical protein
LFDGGKSMKLRIRGNSIRLRLTQSEVETFETVGAVEESVNFGNQDKPDFCYVLEKSGTQNLQASFDDGKITVSVPKAIADGWVNSEQVGIEGDDGELQILIEKDFACLTPRKGEDESDNFPHPKLEKSC